jgi:hypothetical protein
MTRKLLPSLLAASPLALLAPAGATAAPWTCEASVVRGTLGPAPAIEPVTANQDGASCLTQSAGGALPARLPGGATGSLLRQAAPGRHVQVPHPGALPGRERTAVPHVHAAAVRRHRLT